MLNFATSTWLIVHFEAQRRSEVEIDQSEEECETQLFRMSSSVLTLSGLFGSAPCCIKVSHDAKWPALTATTKGVSPVVLTWSTREGRWWRLWWTMPSIIWGRLRLAAKCKAPRPMFCVMLNLVPRQGWWRWIHPQIQLTSSAKMFAPWDKRRKRIVSAFAYTACINGVTPSYIGKSYVVHIKGTRMVTLHYLEYQLCFRVSTGYQLLLSVHGELLQIEGISTCLNQSFPKFPVHTQKSESIFLYLPVGMQLTA